MIAVSRQAKATPCGISRISRRARQSPTSPVAASTLFLIRSSAHFQLQRQRRCIVIRSRGGDQHSSSKKKPKPTKNSDASSTTTTTTTTSNTPFGDKNKTSSPSSSASSSRSSSSFFVQRLQPPLTAFCIGTLAGAMGSLAGMGGGFVMIPLMTSSLLRLSQHQAHGTSLFAVAATGLSGAVAYADQVHYEAALAITATAMLTARLGARTTTFLSENALKRALGVLLLVMGPAVPLKAYTMKQIEQHEKHDKQQQQQLSVTSETRCTERTTKTAEATIASTEVTLSSSPHLLPSTTYANEVSHDNSRKSIINHDDDNNKNYISLLHRTLVPAGIGVGSGFLAGLFGVGGGTLVVPALAILHADEITTHHQALGTSLAAMTLPAAVGTYTHWSVGNVAMRNGIAPALAVGALLGASIGGKTALQIPESTLQWGFSALLTALGVRTLWKTK